MIKFITENIVTIITAVIGSGAWYFERRQRIASAKLTEGDALAKMQEAYRGFIDDQNAVKEELKTLINDCHSKFQLLENKYHLLENIYTKLKSKCDSCTNIQCK